MFKNLLDKYLNESMTASEFEQFKQLLHEPENQELFRLSLENSLDKETYIDLSEALDEASLFGKLSAHFYKTNPIEQRSSRIHQIRRWSMAAASVLLILSIGAYFWTNNKNVPAETSITDSEDIPPGKQGAILTLSDGSEVVLDSLGNGLVAMQNGTQVLLENGQLAYDPVGNSNDLVYNTISTPKGRQFSLLLPDGTRVWLNAASSLRYPTVFRGKERMVQLTGEAYFEVSKNQKMPFKAIVNNIAEVEVLGTHFNVNAYDNEASLNTTLLEGSVKVNGKTIKPGQQARVLSGQNQQQRVELIANPDIENVMAWKDGLFVFEGIPFKGIMRQLERWYDIEVVYEAGVPDIELAGKITRDVSLNGLLTGFSKLGVRYELTGRTLIILP